MNHLDDKLFSAGNDMHRHTRDRVPTVQSVNARKTSDTQYISFNIAHELNLFLPFPRVRRSINFTIFSLAFVFYLAFIASLSLNSNEMKLKKNRTTNGATSAKRKEQTQNIVTFSLGVDGWMLLLMMIMMKLNEWASERICFSSF